MRTALAIAAVLTIVTTTHATITASHEFVHEGTLTTGESFTTWQFSVHVSDDDDWTAAGIDLDLDTGTFYQDTLGGNPPNPALFPTFPDVEWDSYYTSPADYPNTTYRGDVVGIASTQDTATRLDTDWFDTDPTGDGDFVILQVTVLAEPGWLATGLLQYAAADTGGQLFDYTGVIPEPASLALCGLVGLAVFRRR